MTSNSLFGEPATLRVSLEEWSQTEKKRIGFSNADITEARIVIADAEKRIVQSLKRIDEIASALAADWPKRYGDI